MTDVSFRETAGYLALAVAFGAVTAVAGAWLVGTETFGDGLVVAFLTAAVMASTVASAPGGDE